MGLPEEGRAAAMDLHRLAADGKVPLVAPRLLSIEIGNILWTKARRGQLSSNEATRSYDFFWSMQPRSIDTGPLARSVLGLAIRHNQTVYASKYLTLALTLKGDFVTDDRKLFNAVERSLPFVRLLGTASLTDLN